MNLKLGYSEFIGLDREFERVGWPLMDRSVELFLGSFGLFFEMFFGI